MESANPSSRSEEVPRISHDKYSDNSETDNVYEVNSDKKYSLPATDSEGGNLTDAQREYFKDSKAVDKDGNLLVLYHGTPYAGFNTFKGGWFTTSKKDADSYGGNYEGALYDPEEKGGSKTLTAGDFKVGYMTFDSKEDADDFKKAHPLAEEAMTIDKLDEAIDNAEWEGNDELASSLESKREAFKKIAKDYREYEFAHMVDSSWNDLLSNPEAYTLDDFKRAFLAFDSNAFFDDLDDMDSDDERKDALIEAMHYAMDEGDASAESWNGLTFKTRVPRNGSGISKKDINRRTYKVYANIENPAILDANGRHSEFESGDIYDAIKEERAKGVHDGVIVNNWRVGRYQQLGTVVVPFGNNKVKLTTNQNPTSTDDIRYSLVGEVGVSRLKKDGKPIKSQLDIAKQLETEGKTSEEIFDETGWEKGADGKWRFDIPDLKLDFDKIDKLGDDGRASLGDVIKNKKTWSTYKRMYPELEDYSIHFMSDKETTTKGYADVEDQIIMINKAKMESPEYMNGVLVHEIQHVIQVDEGFALGGTPEDLPYDQGIYDLMMEAHRANMKYNQAPEGSEEKKLLEKERDELDDKYNKATYDMYRRLAGEVDARNAQDRTKYEYDLRRYMPISSTEDTPRDKQIVWGTRDVDGRYSLAYHGSSADFDAFDNSFIGTGEGYQAHGYGIYVALNEKTGKRYADAIGRKNRSRIYKGEAIDGNRALEMAWDLSMDSRNIHEARRRADRYSDLAEEDEMKNLWKQAFDILNNSKKSDFSYKPSKILYDVDIPEDTGKNYLVEGDVYSGKKLDDVISRISDANAENEEYNDHFADVIYKIDEEENVIGRTIVSRLEKDGFNGDKKKASEALSRAGFAGIKYNGEQDGPCAVIFNPDDVKIENKTRYSLPEAESLVQMMKDNAEALIPRMLTGEIWENEIAGRQFDTPIGKVKFGENQLRKNLSMGRQKQFGMLIPTITRPDVVVEEYQPEENAERQTKYVFIKTFKDNNGNKFVNYASVSVKKDGMEVVESSHYLREKQVIDKIQHRHMLWNRFEFDSTSLVQNGSTDQSNVGADTGKGSETFGIPNDNGKKYSLASPSDALSLYNQEVMKKSFLNREAWQDSMLGLKVLQDAVEKATGKPIKDFENAYMAENSMSSRNLVEMNDFKNHEFKAILDAVKASGFDITDKDQLKAFNDYIMAKHGIERNRYMSVRKAINSDENLSDEDKEAKMAGYRTAIDLIRQKNLPWEQAQKEMDAVAESFGGILGEDFSGLTSVLGIEMENPDGSNKSKDDIRKEIYDGAYDLVNASEQSHKTDDLWKAINAATGKTLQTINDGGLISNDSLDFIKGMYDYYIPLKGWEEETAMDMYQYLGEQYGNGNLLKKAEGRISVADDPLATIGNNGLVAISRKNRNLMKQKFLFMVLNHPSNLVKTNRPWAMKDLNDNWVIVGPTFADDATPEEIKEAVDDFEEDMKKRAKAEPDKYKRIAQGTKLPVKIDDRSLRQHQVLVYQNGVPYVMTVTGSPRAAQALNGATNPDVGSKFRQGVTKLTRTLASLNTALNPDFVLSNLFRDMGYTHSMLAVKEGSDYAKKYSSNWRGLTLSVNGKISALKMAGLIKRYENDNLDMSNEDDRLFNEFMKGGGETGYTFVNSIEDYKKIIQDTLKGEKNVLVKAKEAVGNALETFSRWAEDIARFAAYKTSRQMGRSVERSIWDAKEVSVNFNKKGAGDKFTEELSVKEFSHWSGFAAQYGRAYLMFMNAGVQGLNNMITVARKSPKKFTAIMAAHALVGALIPLANMLIRSLTGGDDDDYWNQPEYTRQSNITLAIPGTDKYLAIPLAIEMRVFYGLGEMFMDMFRNPKDKTPTQWAWRLAEISAGLLPFDVTGEGGIGKNLAPSIARPILDVNANENWMGLPINRTSFQYYTPKFKLASSYTDKTLISVSKMLNKAIGGSDYTDSGTILDQFNDPAAAQYLFEQYFGGLGQSIGRIIKDMGAVMSGKIGELKPRDLIILNRFVKDASQEQKDKRINTIWFNEKDKMERVNANANGLIRDIKETSDENERARLINELNIIRESPEFAGLKVWKEYNSALNKVSNSDLDDDTKNDLKYAIKKEMVGLVKGDEELVSEGKSELEEIKANRQKIEN